jgi:GNAT superfamily N-acetyltransferase
VDVEAVLRWYAGAPHMFSTQRDLRAFGYTPGYAWMKFERDDDPAPAAETDLRIEETVDAATFARVCAEGFGLRDAPAGFVGAPGFRCFLAWDGSEPAACGALYADGGSAWLGVAATRPAFRGRGAQRALLAARIDAARATGARRIVTETGERAEGRADQSYRNILRAGFREAYLRPNWLSPR